MKKFNRITVVLLIAILLIVQSPLTILASVERNEVEGQERVENMLLEEVEELPNNIDSNVSFQSDGFVEVTIASKESGITSDFKNFDKLFEVHNTGKLRVFVLTDFSMSMGSWTNNFPIDVPSTLEKFELIGTKENGNVVIDVKSQTGEYSGIYMNGVESKISNFDIISNLFSIKGGSPGMNVNMTLENVNITGACVVVGSSIQFKNPKDYPKASETTVVMNINNSTIKNLIGESDLAGSIDDSNIVKDITINVNDSNVENLFAVETDNNDIKFEKNINSININMKESSADNVGTIYKLYSGNIRTKFNIGEINYSLNKANINSKDLDKGNIWVLSYDIRYASDYKVGNINFVSEDSKVKTIITAYMVPKTKTDLAPISYSINDINYNIKGGEYTTLGLGAYIYNLKTPAGTNTDLDYKVNKSVKLEVNNAKVNAIYAGNNNLTKKYNDSNKEENDYYVSLVDSELNNFYRGIDTDALGKLVLNIKNIKNNPTNLIGVDYSNIKQDTKFGDVQNGSESILNLDNGKGLMPMFFGGFTDINTNAPIMVRGANIKLPDGSIKPFAIISSKNVKVDIIDKNDWGLEDAVIIVNPKFVNTISEDRIEFVHGWNPTKWKIDDQKVELGFKIENGTPNWYLNGVLVYRVTYNGNGNTSGAVPVDNNSPYDKDSIVTVLDKAGLMKDGYKFIGWNTNKDSTDALYKVGDTFEITEDVVLYAIWEKLDDKVVEDKEPTDYFSIIWDWGHTSTSEIKNDVKPGFNRAYLNGYPDGSVKPKGEITRGEVAAIIARLHADLEEIDYSTETKYADVKATDWYAKHIAYVSDKGLMEGYEDGSFKPEEKITRAEYATVVARFKNLDVVETSFVDSSDHWASEYIGAVAKENWITGYPDGSFKPMNNITREEVVTMTNKMLDRKVDEQGIGDLNIKKFTDLQYGTWSYYELVEATNSHEYVRRGTDSIVEDWKSIID